MICLEDQICLKENAFRLQSEHWLTSHLYKLPCHLFNSRPTLLFFFLTRKSPVYILIFQISQSTLLPKMLVSQMFYHCSKLINEGPRLKCLKSYAQHKTIKGHRHTSERRRYAAGFCHWKSSLVALSLGQSELQC